MTSVQPSPPFAAALRSWRRQRSTSQLALATAAGTTTRHLSFLETGRSRPSAAMVHRLAEALTLPLRARNDLLASAGFPPAYEENPLGAPDLQPFRAVVSRLLQRHEPYPAFAVDGRWNLVDANAPAAALLAGEERNLVRLLFTGAWRPMVDNWDEVALLGLRRLEDDVARHPGDPELLDLLDLATTATRGIPPRTHPGSPLVLCPHFRIDGRIVRTVGMVARFSSARDVTLDELRVELVYPADAEAEAFFTGVQPG
ncbi:helix-turn-helix protein [Kineococcus xinjiangensis]|uniref:Helix-turn-helix protein n=1 Tax=Kineococcus xinjiangensis TaxID=512762 RepID=A0A2S6IMM6_9ACTN|nr:helix-turn-helix domain-containing protein [Kineococcus xinjiangensis]PPK95406.1 helix-turn-helix protein [Kineococcus xinjiangensis]